MQQALVAEFSEEPAYRQELARTLGNFGILMSQANRLREAEDFFRRAVDVLEELKTESAAHWQELIEGYSNLSSLLTAAGGRSQEVEKIQRRIIELRKKLEPQENKKGRTPSSGP